MNHVLLITVINPHYTITCDLIHQICSPYGKVNRIVIFKKNGVQAMVEFDSIESAKRAKSMLHGCDIYSGCCTLRIEFAKPTKLNIHRNDNYSFDYTDPNLSNDGASGEVGTGAGGGHDSGGLVVDSGDSGGLGVESGGDSGGDQPVNSGDAADPQTRSASTGNHAPILPHQPPHHLHHSRGGVAHHARGGPGGRGGAQHFHHPVHHSHSNNPHHAHVQQPTPVPHGQSGGGLGVYGATNPQEQSAVALAGDSFHHDEVNFSNSRSAGGGANNVAPGAYVGVDSYLQQGPHHGGGLHANLYPSRQDGHHPHHLHHHHQHHHPHHHHHHHSRPASGPNHGPHFSSGNASNALMAGPHMGLPQGTVMMVYGLQPDRINCDKLFNLFCLYGNVNKIKFLRSKEGCAMVQMGDVQAVDRCASSLNKITLFGSEIQISYSKQVHLHDVLNPFILPDGSPSFKDFSGNKNNRFKKPEVASKNRILPPSQLLHFFNAPSGITEDEFMHLFKQTAGHEPVSIKIFTPKADNSKSFSGLVTFKDPTEATEALVLCNHFSMPKPGVPHPYILRLCFSPPTYTRQGAPAPAPPPYTD